MADDEDEGGAAAANGHPGQGSRSSPENAGASFKQFVVVVVTTLYRVPVPYFIFLTVKC